MIKQLLTNYKKRAISKLRITFSEYVFAEIQLALANKNIALARELFADYEAITVD